MIGLIENNQKEKYITVGAIIFKIPKGVKLVRNLKDFFRQEMKKRFLNWYNMEIIPTEFGKRNGKIIPVDTLGRKIFGVPGTKGSIKFRFRQAGDTATEDIFKVTVKLPEDMPFEAILALKTICGDYKSASMPADYIEKLKKRYVEKYQKGEHYAYSKS